MRRRHRCRGLRGAALLVLALAALGGAAVPAARADGDPASDYLLVQSSFLSPFDGHVAAAASTGLVQLLREAQAKGFPLKVAVIVTPYDLGSVPVLFRKPELYAKFLGEEDYYYWQDELLVVMPNGYGLYKASKLPPADAAAIKRLAFTDSTRGTTLVLAAQRAVRTLAALHGITLGAAAVKPARSSAAANERIEIGAAALAVLLLACAYRFGRRRLGALVRGRP